MIKKILDTTNESLRKCGATEHTQIPVSPRGCVLFPGGMPALKIFEERYLSMVKVALKSGAPFGIVLIKRGAEVGEPATPESVDTFADIQTWDMRQLGVLHIGVAGGSRFRIGAIHIGAHGLLHADVANIADDASTTSPPMSVLQLF